MRRDMGTGQRMKEGNRAFRHGMAEPASVVVGRPQGVVLQPESTDAAVAPFGVGERHTWLHPHCWPAWYRGRRADAFAALRSFGIPVPVAAHTERDTAAGRQSGIIFSQR
jgi:hypothetical protein